MVTEAEAEPNPTDLHGDPVVDPACAGALGLDFDLSEQLVDVFTGDGWVWPVLTS